MLFNRKVEISFSQEDIHILDGQSKICNWLYNKLLDILKEDYEKNNNAKKLLSGRSLRNQVPSLKQEYSFLKSVHSSPLKNTAIRLKDSYIKFFQENNVGYPKFRAWKKKWFSLYYDEPNKGFKLLDNKNLRISLGKTEDNKRIRVMGRLKENLNLRDTDKIKTFRLCKQQGDRFYAVFTIERESLRKERKKEKWLSIDPNHKNFFVAIDYKGESYEVAKLPQLKYWDKAIDRIKSKRDKCNRKARKRKTKNTKTYYLPSKRWVKLNKALDMAYHRRREQIKSSLYSISNEIAKKYDHVAIGDYTPSLDTAKYKTMHRSMLNQEVIGQLRNTLKWIMERSGKTCSVVDERDTTKTCFICGHKEKKNPSIREFTCSKCETHLGRDINSAINIAKKDSLLSGSDYLEWSLGSPKYTIGWSYVTSKLLFANAK